MANNHLDTSLFDKAVIFAVKAHQGTERRGKGFPYIIHPMEAAEIAATITDDQEILAAAILHDTVEDTPVTIGMIQEEFGERVASLVECESDVSINGKSAEESWHDRKQDSINRLEAATLDAKIVALADKLSNMRAIAKDFAISGDTIWNQFHVKDKSEHEWRFRALARCLSPLADTDAYKEFIFLINKVFYKGISAEKPSQIDIGDYVRSGEGYTAESYNAKDGKTMVKLYKDFIPEEVPFREQRVVKTLVAMGVNTPRVGRIVTDGKRLGVEFQLISPKKSFARSIADEPGRIDEFATRFARAARKLHSTPCDTTVFGNVKDFFNQKISINKYFTDEEKKKMHEFVRSVPAAQTCLHGDLHFGNIITDGTSDYWIDMADFRFGNPVFDLGMLFHIARNNDEEFNMPNYHTSQKDIVRFWEVFVKEYFGDSKSIEAVEDSLKPIAALYMVYFSTLADIPDKHMEYIRKNLLAI